MGERAVRRCDDQHATIESLRSAQTGKAITDDVGEGDSQRSSRTWTRTPSPRSAGSMRSERRCSVIRERPG